MMFFRNFRRYLLFGAAAAFLAVFLVVPVFSVIAEGCDPKLLLEVFRNRVYRDALMNSALIACTTTALVALVSLPLALLYDRFRFPGRDGTPQLFLLPMILPPFVGALGFQKLLGHYGVVNTLLARMGAERIDFLGGSGAFWSVCIIEALHLYPVFYLNVVTALGNVDPALDEAAANAGASRAERFFRITLPLIRPGIFAGGSLVLIWSFTELGTPLMLGYNATTAVQIFNGLMELETSPVPYALVFLMLTVSLGLYLASRCALAGGKSVAVKGVSGRTPKELRGAAKFLAPAAFGFVTLLALSPHAALVLTAFSRPYYGGILPDEWTLSHFNEALSNALVIPSIGNSLRYSLWAMAIAIVLGVVSALGLVRWHLKGRILVDLLAMAPLAIPGIVVAFGYLGVSVKWNVLPASFNPVENPAGLLAIAYAIRRIPYVVRSTVSGLEQIPEELEDAARVFGATPWRTFRRVTLPLIAANVLVGGLFAFSFSMLEVSDSLLLAQKAQHFPITRALYELSQMLGSGAVVASAFGVWAMCFLAATIGAACALLGRKIGAVFKF